MRMKFLAAAWLVTLTPGFAIGSDLYDQFLAARSLFAVDPSVQGTFYTDYAKAMMEGIEGTWFPIGIVQVESDDEQADAYTSTCERMGTVISVKNDYTMEFERKAGNGSITSIYTARGGLSFGVYTDQQEMFEWLAFTDDMLKSNPTIAMGPLASTNGLATILRPSPDILIIETNHGVPQIFGRCPS